MSDKSLDASTIQSLSNKLDEFAEVLSPEEHAVLLGLIGMAGATMEHGHASVDTEGAAPPKAVLTQSAGRMPKLSVGIKDAFRAVPGVINPGGEVMDSVGVGVLCVSWSKDYSSMTNPMDKVTQPGANLARIRGLRQYR